MEQIARAAAADCPCDGENTPIGIPAQAAESIHAGRWVSANSSGSCSPDPGAISQARTAVAGSVGTVETLGLPLGPMASRDTDWSTIGFEFSRGLMRFDIQVESEAHLDEVDRIYKVDEVVRMMDTAGVERRMRFVGLDFDFLAPFPKTATMIWTAHQESR